MLLTPVAIGYLTQLILVTLITAYFLWHFRFQRSKQLACLIRFFIGLTGFIAALFLEATTLSSLRLTTVFLQIPLLAGAWMCLLQFLYRFPALPAPWRREARAVFCLSALYTLWEVGYAGYRFWQYFNGILEYRIDWTDYLLLLVLLWAPVVLIRQWLRELPPGGPLWRRLWVGCCRPTSRAGRALWGFSLIFSFVAGLSVLNILRTFYLIPVSLANMGIAVGILVALFAFTLIYLNQRPETTSFIVKLSGVTLTTLLAILGIAGWAVSPAHIADYAPEWPAERALRFTPNARGGYDIAEIPFQFEDEPGRDLALDDGQVRGCSEGLDFVFPFYGREHRAVYVCNDGVIALGQPVRYREFQYHYGAGVPLLMPLLLDLDPTISPGAIFARQEADRLLVTWERQRAFRHPELEFTFQAVLYPDGRFDFRYAALPETLPYRPNDDPGAVLWAVGALPGSRTGAPPRASLRDLPFSGEPAGVVQDFYLEFRRHLHILFAPLTGLILAASAFIIVGLPLMLQASLVQPLHALLGGVQQMEAGEYAVNVPVQAPDEIGFLTRAFNHLSAELGDLIETLEARVAARTAALDAANAQLRAEIIEREQAQAALLEQQRALARLEEREAVSRELHDGLGQMMGYINVQAQAAQALLERGQPDAAQHTLAELIPAAQEAHADLRAHILGLRAQTLSQPNQLPLDFYGAVRDYIALFSARYQLPVTLTAPEPFPEAAFAPAVEEQITRIIQEGLTNARKHAQAQRVEVAFSFIGEWGQITIADNGIGFSIVDCGLPIVDTESQNPKSAIQNHFGLQGMRERAEQVGGTLEIRTVPGQGTRLLVTFPRFLPTAEDADGARVQSLRLLLADDHPLFLDGLRNLLIARGLTVVGVAHSGREALEKTRALRPDVVVLDVHMPQGGGLDALRALKTEFPEIKVVMLTAAEDDAALFEAIQSGASGYLLKSLSANKFCAALTGLLRGEAPFAPGLAARVLDEFARLSAQPTLPETDGLSSQQWDILRLISEGLTYKEVGAALHLTEASIKYHIGRILDILGLENRAQAIAYYQQTRG